MKTLQFLIDHICADFTVNSLLTVARTCVAGGACTAEDIQHAIMKRDPSLDVRCAEGLAEGVVQTLCDTGEFEVRDSHVYATATAARPE